MNGEERLRNDLVEYGKKMLQSNLVIGPGGNISARKENTFLISPSGIGFEEMKPEDLVTVSCENGKKIKGGRPSSEVAMHWYCYKKRPDVGAVVHAHPPTTIGVIGGGGMIEPMFPEFVAFIGELAKIDFITPCTIELAEGVASQLENVNGVLMVAHGALTVGVSLKEAFLCMEIIEESARVLTVSKMFHGPRVLTQEERESIRQLDAEKYRTELLKSGQ